MMQYCLDYGLSVHDCRSFVVRIKVVRAAALSACVFLAISLVTGIVGCVRPEGVESLLSAED
jgi:hypothetical protein